MTSVIGFVFLILIFSLVPARQTYLGSPIIEEITYINFFGICVCIFMIMYFYVFCISNVSHVLYLNPIIFFGDDEFCSFYYFSNKISVIVRRGDVFTVLIFCLGQLSLLSIDYA
jgi:hypothetical protein